MRISENGSMIDVRYFEKNYGLCNLLSFRFFKSPVTGCDEDNHIRMSRIIHSDPCDKMSCDTDVTLSISHVS